MRACFLALLLLLGIATSPANAATPADRDPGTALTFVLLREARLPEPQALRARLEKRLAGRLKIEGMDVSEPGKDTAVLFSIAGGTALVGLIDAPLPAGQIDDLCAAAWFWKTACADTAQHRAQLVVSVVKSSLDRLDTSLLLTDLAAAAMDGDDNAIASYWMSALRPRAMFLKASAGASRATPPAWLWVDFRVSGGPQGVSMSTEGMTVYGLREIEVKDVKRPASDILTLIVGTASYLVSAGPVIKDGDTIGDSPSLGIVVRHDKSYWREGQDVYRVVWTK